MRVLSVVGARPQFIKAAPVSWALRGAGHQDYLVHTGQHYDYEMSDIFFRELEIPAPDANLEIGSASHGAQTGRMLEALERKLLEVRPDVVLVYGDTNSTLAGALAGCKLGIPVAHVEAGLRSFNRAMPEEHNRVLADHCSSVLCCPTDTAVANLAREGITEGVHRTGDTMFDMLRRARPRAEGRDGLWPRIGVTPGEFLLATVHRAENTDDPDRLSGILEAFRRLETAIVWPMHPRTRARLDGLAAVPGNVRVIDPVGYVDMVALETGARVVLTDSGGVQKEALWAGVPCVTLRTETEWVETVDCGWNKVAGTDPDRVVAAVHGAWPGGSPPPLFGEGAAAPDIVSILDVFVAARS